VSDKGLQIRLQERYRRLAKSGYEVFHREMGYLRDFVLGSPRLHAIVEALDRAEPSLSPADWVESHFINRSYDWPPTEAGRAKVIWHIVQELGGGDENSTVSFAYKVSGASNFDDAVNEMSSALIEPLISYLQEQLAVESDVLYLLARYRRRVEWFERTRLFQEFERDPQRGEASYDQDLRRFLFEEGIDYPFSKPASASGEADVVAGLDSDDPLVLDVKIYDGDARGPAYLSKGIRQLVQYAHDYGKVAGHLVIENVTVEDLELPTDEPGREWPPLLRVAGVTLFLVAIRARPPLATASKLGRAAPRRITREQLVNELD
jgi:hypothetical protein